MKLNELFKSEIPVQVVRDNIHDYIVTANVDGKEMRFKAYDLEVDRRYDIEFSEIDDSGRLTFQKTGTGKEFKVFAFVQSCIQNFLANSAAAKANRINAMYMSAYGDKRFELYKRMVKRAAGAAWEVNAKAVDDDDIFLKDGGGNILLTRI